MVLYVFKDHKVKKKVEDFSVLLNQKLIEQTFLIYFVKPMQWGTICITSHYIFIIFIIYIYMFINFELIL